MNDKFTVQIAQRGLVTIPKALRDAYNLKTGDTLTMLDLGGVFVISPRSSQVDQLADEISRSFQEADETLESMLSALREARESYSAKGANG
jgi:bifunctional DNA-binding transcriptional regulator/antitoxin component of YhaV-PrlF toxin-antitoxin module